MRSCIVVLILSACVQREVAPPPDETDDPQGVPLDYGVTKGCSVPRQGGYGPFYAAGRAMLVHGDAPEERDLAEKVMGWYGGAIALTPVLAADLTDAQREQNLFVIGSAASNPLLPALNGALPVWFEEQRFTFGGYRYEEHGNGLSMVHPSPFANDAWLLLHVGNSVDGAYSTFTVRTGGFDYVTTRGRGVVMQNGDLCRDEPPWGFYAPFDDDGRAAWDAWVAGLRRIDTPHHTYFFVAGSDFDSDAGWMPQWQDERYLHALDVLEVDPLDQPIATYLYPDAETKGQVTGYPGNGHANDLNFEVHAIYGGGVYAVGAHEDVHVIAWHRIGPATSTLLGEGLAVMVDGEWWGEDLAAWVATYRDEGELPPLRSLIDAFWTFEERVTYPISGHFVRFLGERLGMDEVKRIYGAPDVASALEEAFDASLAELEEDWLASVE